MESPVEEVVSNAVVTSENEILETNKRIIEFVHDLKNAIENGHLKNDEKPHQLDLKSNAQSTDGQGISSTTLNQISNLMNVNNLSNHTFSYIINWLKTHQQQKQQQDQQQQQQQTPAQSDEANKVICFSVLHNQRSKISETSYYVTSANRQSGLIYFSDYILCAFIVYGVL
jgi:hypothetical protein